MKVKFIPQNVEYEIKPGQSVLHLAQDHGIYIKSVCRGVPSCAECRVRVDQGDDKCLPPAPKEMALIGTGYFIDQRRLSCQLKCVGDIVVDMTDQIEKEKRLKGLTREDNVEDTSVRAEEGSGGRDNEN
jgi:ferredoxin, 2Fe-2S